MGPTKTIHVSHLGGIEASFQCPETLDPKKPSLILVNSFTTSSELYRAQFEDQKLKDAMNLIAIEPLGHGQTRAKCEHFTYWDTAIMNLQVLEALGIFGMEKVFALGTSQGGWIVTRMALLAPDRINGIIVLGSSMDIECNRTRSLGCWDAPGWLSPWTNSWTTKVAAPGFELTDEYCKDLIDAGFGLEIGDDARKFWTWALKNNYRGDDGRKRIRMAAINLRDRDGLCGRVTDVQCPVLWLHGTNDGVYSVANAQVEIKWFTNSSDVRLQEVSGGTHFLSFSRPKEVNEETSRFVAKYSN